MEAVFYQFWQGNRISQSKVAVDSLFVKTLKERVNGLLLTFETSHKLKHVYGPGGKTGCVRKPSDRERTISQQEYSPIQSTKWKKKKKKKKGNPQIKCV